MDPRGSRIASGSIFPESYPEGQSCPYHTAETVVTVCTDCPVLNEDGTETGLYYLAGEFCPEESKKEICLPNYGREQIGSAVAGDGQWDYAAATAVGTCTLHTSEYVPPVDPNNPFDPFNPFDPNNPGVVDPNNPGGITDPDNPGGTSNPNNPGGTTQPTTPDVPIDPLPPIDSMAG